MSSTVRDLGLRLGVEFEARGEHDLKGVPGKWAVHAVGAPAAPEPRSLPGHARAGGVDAIAGQRNEAR